MFTRAFSLQLIDSIETVYFLESIHYFCVHLWRPFHKSSSLRAAGWYTAIIHVAKNMQDHLQGIARIIQLDEDEKPGQRASRRNLLAVRTPLPGLAVMKEIPQQIEATETTA